MNKDFKEWLCKLTGTQYQDLKAEHLCEYDIELEVLIKAMWAINKKYNENCNKGFCIKQNDLLNAYIAINEMNDTTELSDYYWFTDNSEQRCLILALKYIYENKLINK